jgi:protein-ribulosamine 3-kinase
VSHLQQAVASALGHAFGEAVQIDAYRPLGGGSINRTEIIDTTAGTFVLKSNRHAPPGMFQAEADGLATLRSSGTSLVIPRVIAVNDAAPAFLVLEYLDAGARVRDFDERLGRGLAELHRSTNARYGFGHDNYCGATTQPNSWSERWIDFYAASRLGHQARIASDGGRLDARDRAAIDRVINRLGDWIGEPTTGPSLIHGDLWSGNLHGDTGGRPAILDPAAYFAHREAEFGMMTLFGGFSPRVFDAYHETLPLEPGWRDRNALYRLYHVMNHLNLFGGGYHADVMAIVRRYVS